MGEREIHSGSRPDPGIGRTEIEDDEEEAPRITVAMSVCLLVVVIVVRLSVYSYVHPTVTH